MDVKKLLCETLKYHPKYNYPVVNRNLMYVGINGGTATGVGITGYGLWNGDKPLLSVGHGLLYGVCTVGYLWTWPVSFPLTAVWYFSPHRKKSVPTTKID
uniref:Transmembrane protein n=1 Tax=Pithovirus LCPAC304 TaxID=2506594 RepID=A0A481Z809_9VIRU|nr:MAG: hypothetical protein LCPAC304_03950 [Pithovirus LCPAC304]